MRKKVSALSLLFLLFLLGGCNSQPQTSMPAFTPTSTLTSTGLALGGQALTPQPGAKNVATDLVTTTRQSTTTAVATEPAAAISTMAAPLTITVEATLAISSSTRAKLLEPLNIRSGPGQVYPVVGFFAAQAQVEIIAQSADETWWKVVCPTGLDVAECWITSSNRFSEVIAPVALPNASPPPIPSATSTPTVVPCVVNPPADWVRYRIAPGDTLSEISSQMGGSQAAIWRVNCLGSEDIRAGADLFVPPLPAASIGGGTASSTGSTAVMPFAGIAAALSDIEPGGGVCPPAFLAVLPEGANFGIVTMAPTCSLADSVWEVGEQICLYPRGLDTSQPVTLTITAPKGDSTSYSLLPGNHWMRWSLLPGIARGIYTVEAVQDGTQIAGAVNVTDPFRPKILVQTDEVPSGGEIEAALSGFLANQPLFLYRYDPSRSEWALSRQLPTPQLGRSGEGYYTATIEGPAGSYAVHTGAAGSVCSGVDPRVFSVK